MLYEVSNAFGSRLCTLDYSQEEWQRVSAALLQKRKLKLFSRIIRALLILLIGLFGNLPPLWKWLMFLMAAISVVLGIYNWVSKPSVMDAEGHVTREEDFDLLVSNRLLAWFRSKNRNYGSCHRKTDPGPESAETAEKIPLSFFLPSESKEKPKTDLRSLLLLGVLALILVALLFLLIRNWIQNVMDSTILTTFVYAELGLAALLFFARPKTRSRKSCVVLLCIFLFVFFGLNVYSGIVSNRCMQLIEGRLSFQNAESASGCFIVRYGEDASGVIYALPGDPSRCAYYVKADPDVIADAADFSGSGVTVRVQVFSSTCSVFSAADRSCVRTLDVGVSLPAAVATQQSYDLHPDNLQIVQTILASFE